MTEIFQVSSVIQKLNTLVDRTVRLTIDCQELTPEQAQRLHALIQKQGWFLFKENPFEIEEIPKENAPEFGNDKTPSERLRNTLYVYWKECTQQRPDFDTFYRQWMEKKIEEIKEKLPRV